VSRRVVGVLVVEEHRPVASGLVLLGVGAVALVLASASCGDGTDESATTPARPTWGVNAPAVNTPAPSRSHMGWDTSCIPAVPPGVACPTHPGGTR
jgi:hypothetical protein